MIKRIVDISEPAYLRLKNHQLLIERDSTVVGTVPIEDLGVLILQHPAIVITQSVIVACQKTNAVVIMCDERHLPYSIMLPLTEGNTLHSRILREQVSVNQPTRKRIWKQIVQTKIREQIVTLNLSGKDSIGIERMLDKVKAGDRENHEAQAAQRYWPLLMGKDFRRDPGSGGANAILNYGYSIFRALVARALVAGGIHPSIGIHHHNQYNGLALADDIMEPFRPWVDWKVCDLLVHQSNPQINRDIKQALLSLLTSEVIYKTQTLPLMVATHRLIADFRRTWGDRTATLVYPRLKDRCI